jgi:hypothetical protein
MAQTLEEKRMSRKRVTGGVFVALAVALTVGSLVASNMAASEARDRGRH